ncbi:DUF726-domain-containing protein [Xylariaceae sp. FL0255]|nr:DUF726-domain-containing protein [Xylariaceae sp. FL0255]
MASFFHHKSDTAPSGDAAAHQRDESLNTVLETAEDRGALTILICDITEIMRTQLLDTFDPSYTTSDKNYNDESSKKKALQAREKEVSEERMVHLKNSALAFFDDWRDSVIARVGEVINSRNTAEEKPKSSSQGNSSSVEPEKDEQDGKIDEALHRLYPPVKTTLRQLDQVKRALVLQSLLLLMLSLQHYNAHSRTLLVHITTSLGLPIKILSQEERKVAQGLLEAAKHMSADKETKKRADENQTARRWKMGVAGVAGAALIGVTGGLAAPFLAAGVGTVLGGIGLGATATAGLLGSLAGSSVLVGGLFGAYGARMSSKAMEKYTRDVRDFAFIPTSEKNNVEAHRLRVAIGVSGWLREEQDVVGPWKIIGDGQETFALRYEVEALQSLGNSLRALITSVAWKVAKSEIIKRTVFAALMAGLWPMSLTNAGRIIDNPWSVANQRAQKAGEVLADALINKAQGERPVTLVGYSLGAKVIYVCLQQLAQRKAFGIVENVILLGAPTPSNSSAWRQMRSVVSGRLVNAYSTKDYILGFLYRSSSIQLGVAGLHPIKDVKGVENVDVSDIVEGHTLYRHATAPVLGRIGFEDIDVGELEHEKKRLEKQEKEEQEQRDNAVEGSEHQ